MRSFGIATVALLISLSACQHAVPEAAAPPAAPPTPDPSTVEIAFLRQRLAGYAQSLQDAAVDRAKLERSVEDLSQLNGEITERLQTSTRGVEQLATERATLLAALEHAKAQLAERAATDSVTEAVADHEVVAAGDTEQPAPDPVADDAMVPEDLLPDVVAFEPEVDLED